MSGKAFAVKLLETVFDRRFNASFNFFGIFVSCKVFILNFLYSSTFNQKAQLGAKLL